MSNEFASVGYTAGQLNAIVKLLKKQGGESGPERFLRGELTVQSARPALSITVDYNMSLKDMIAAGRYDWVNDKIMAEYFPAVKRKGMKELAVKLVHFNNRFISSDDAVKEMDNMGLRPATHEELLAFGAKYSDMRHKFPIVALGSLAQVEGGDPRALCLDRGGSKRGISLIWYAFDWDDKYRFLAVRK